MFFFVCSPFTAGGCVDFVIEYVRTIIGGDFKKKKRSKNYEKKKIVNNSSGKKTALEYNSSIILGRACWNNGQILF